MSNISSKAKYRLISCYRHLRKQRRLNSGSDENNNFSITLYRSKISLFQKTEAWLIRLEFLYSIICQISENLR